MIAFLFNDGFECSCNNRKFLWFSAFKKKLQSILISSDIRLFKGQRKMATSYSDRESRKISEILLEWGNIGLQRNFTTSPSIWSQFCFQKRFGATIWHRLHAVTVAVEINGWGATSIDGTPASSAFHWWNLPWMCACKCHRYFGVCWSKPRLLPEDPDHKTGQKWKPFWTKQRQEVQILFWYQSIDLSCFEGS